MNKLLFVLSLVLLSFVVVAEEPEAPDTPPVEITQPTEEVTLSAFYKSLAPHGTWVQDPTYGWVWQPRVITVDVEWRPYCNEGHWVWTNCGWYWKSNYKWGWATFHYGRWTRHATLHWIWVPDCTWGPSWVNWRECDTHLGWAPLPPECTFDAQAGFSYRGKRVEFGFDFGLVDLDFTFVPCHTFLEVNLWRHRVHHRDIVKIYNTTIIHNTYVVRNKIIVNDGCSRVVIERHTNRKINEIRVYNDKKRIERRTKEGISTYRPEVKNTAPQDPRQVEQQRKERQQRSNSRPPPPARKPKIQRHEPRHPQQQQQQQQQPIPPRQQKKHKERH